MLIDLKGDLSPVKLTLEEITSKRLTDFNQAISAKYVGLLAPSFGTTFRTGEFEFLDKLKVDLKNLLHTEQEYEYIAPFEIGDIPESETSLVNSRERRSMAFVTLGTEVKVKGVLKLKALSSFVVRETNKG